MDLIEYAAWILKRLDEGAYWISGLDLEIALLQISLKGHPKFLAPSTACLAQVAKPAEHTGRKLGFNVPSSIPLSASDDELFDFLVSSNWKCWLKGPNYNAALVTSWHEFLARRDDFRALWSTNDRLLLQQHIHGTHHSIAFSAYCGECSGFIQIRKTYQTFEGKVWTALEEETSGVRRDLLYKFLFDSGWTGGGEIEFIEDRLGHSWLMEVNPRFPAWIYGATLCGKNLPAALLQSITHERAKNSSSPSNGFTRIITEIPVELKNNTTIEVGIISKNDRLVRSIMSDIHPSGMPVLANRLRENDNKSVSSAALPENDKILLEVLNKAETSATPFRIVKEGAAQTCFKRIKTTELNCGGRVRFAYSIKTNPDPFFMRLALAHGLLAEAVTMPLTEPGESDNRVLMPGKSLDAASLTSVYSGMMIGALAAAFNEMAKELRAYTGSDFNERLNILEAKAIRSIENAPIDGMLESDQLLLIEHTRRAIEAIFKTARRVS